MYFLRFSFSNLEGWRERENNGANTGEGENMIISVGEKKEG